MEKGQTLFPLKLLSQRNVNDAGGTDQMWESMLLTPRFVAAVWTLFQPSWRKLSVIYFPLIFLLVYFSDLFTKMVVRHYLVLGQEIKVLPFFSLVHVQNTGIAFGLFPNMNLVFIGVGVAMTFFIGWFIWTMRKTDRYSCYVLAAVLAGAWGNLTDRIFFGKVTDFLDFYVGSNHWPAFNIADSAICVSAALLFIHSLKRKK